MGIVFLQMEQGSHTIEIYDFFSGHCNYRLAASVKEFNLLYVQKHLLINSICILERTSRSIFLIILPFF
jgi:hypothetical protein